MFVVAHKFMTGETGYLESRRDFLTGMPSFCYRKSTARQFRTRSAAQKWIDDLLAADAAEAKAKGWPLGWQPEKFSVQTA